MRESLDRYRAVRRQLEEGILPLATSVDGRSFSYQASLHGLLLQAGSYVVLEQGSDRRFGQVVTLEVGRHQGPELAAADGGGARAQVVIRGAEGEGRVLDGDGSSFHDATVRPATPDEVREHLEQTSPRRARLEVGELLLAPGVPFSLDSGGFGRHTFLCGQSGSGKTYSLGVVLEQLLLETDLRLVVLDPNSDFARLGQLQPDADDAQAARYSEATRSLVVYRAGDGLFVNGCADELRNFLVALGLRQFRESPQFFRDMTRRTWGRKRQPNFAIYDCFFTMHAHFADDVEGEEATGLGGSPAGIDVWRYVSQCGFRRE